MVDYIFSVVVLRIRLDAELLHTRKVCFCRRRRALLLRAFEGRVKQIVGAFLLHRRPGEDLPPVSVTIPARIH